MYERTIAAVATPPGEGSVGVIRISGETAIATADKIFRSVSGKALAELSGYSAAYGEVCDGDRVLDDAVALVFKGPKSYTGEDVVEISVHGGSLILREALRLLYKSGAYPAEPGEFTKRAFLNGKTDLTRAESIMGLISARSQSQLNLSRAAHLGKTGEKAEKIISLLTSADAAIAVYSDYPDEDIDGLDRDNFRTELAECAAELKKMLAAYDTGRLLRDGIDTVIVGKPNVGKSTLMNMLSGTERSIVTEIAGTTRDVIEDTVTVGDVLLRLADTAGIRETEDTVESIGVDRARERIASADLVLAVFDGSAPLDDDDRRLLELMRGKNALLILNKSDLGLSLSADGLCGLDYVSISAATGAGYPELCEKIREISGAAHLDPEAAVLINERQRVCCERALDGIEEAVRALECGNTVDAVGVCVDDALSALLSLTGKRVTEEVTNEIFKSFCVGK